MKCLKMETGHLRGEIIFQFAQMISRVLINKFVLIFCGRDEVKVLCSFQFGNFSIQGASLLRYILTME